MAAILPSIGIESDAALNRYFLPYQRAWIMDASRQQLAEKSVRIGWTYADAFKNVRKRLQTKKRDYLFTTKDQGTAFEYVKTCETFAEIFNLTKNILTRGIETYQVPDANRPGFTEEVKVGVIKFDNGSRILAFSSNPNALRAYGGDVGWDEAAFHQRAEESWASMAGRVMWGYDVSVWSSHNGPDTLFNTFVQEAQRGVGGWAYYRVTLTDAVEMGLVEKINETRGTNFTREQFIADCERRCRLPEIAQQELYCNPQRTNSNIVPWSVLNLCKEGYRDYCRNHFEAQTIGELFGELKPGKAAEVERSEKIARWIESLYGKIFAVPRAYRLGFDVAASGQGDLAAIYVDGRETDANRLRALFTCRTEDWNFLKSVLFTFMRRLPAVKAAGDETGLGRQICWEAATEFPNQFEQVNFASEKHDMGFALMNRLSEHTKRFPEAEADVVQDFFSLQKMYQGKRWLFSETKNSLNPRSHCDIAWAGALADRADQSLLGPPTVIVI
jgi:phage FluMu gp28-like protein